MLYSALRPLLFLSDPESAHERVSHLMSAVIQLPGAAAALRTVYGFSSAKLKRTVSGLEFPNPVGMAAGFDKTGGLYPFLSSMGFGSIESGTFTAEVQTGNPKPRMFRFPRQRALLNRMGFNNPGARAAVDLISGQSKNVIRGINIGKSKTAPIEKAEEDYLLSLSLLLPFADYIAVNVSSPNTPGLRLLQESSVIFRLISTLRRHMDGSQTTPLYVKLAPDLSDEQLKASVDAIVSAGADGFILTNTTLDRSLVPGASGMDGGLSGMPLRDRSTEIIRKVFRFTEGQKPIIGVGGISSGRDALNKIRAGASLVQVYTGYIYQGPELPSRICRYIHRHLVQRDCTLDDITGSDVT